MIRPNISPCGHGHRSTRSKALLLAAASLVAWPALAPAQFPDAHDQPPMGWTGPVFKLRQDYPTTAPAAENYPWKTLDFKTQPKEYAQAVLAYCLEGNTDAAVDWQLEKNTVRNWYHAPWMHDGNNGREFIHGLTKERPAGNGDLHPNQTQSVQNWAVSAYNPAGGYVIGQVWKDPNNPDASVARFPDGAVSIKLLFTQATDAAGPTQVPFLKNAKTWKADINRNAQAPDGPNVSELRLLQIDLAVRDSRADATTGWVFATFIYNGDAAGATPYDRMVPVGVMWGNDPGVTPSQVAAGTVLQETWLNPDAKPLMTHYGWADRLNGPVDNRVSSCLSCHSTAQTPPGSRITPPDGSSDMDRLRWFRNIKAGDPFDDVPGEQALDYSLQLSTGILRFHLANGTVAPAVVHGQTMLFTRDGRRVFPVGRDDLTEQPKNPVSVGLAERKEPTDNQTAPGKAPWAWQQVLLGGLGGLVLGVTLSELTRRRGARKS
jgi:hypothetical protein